MEKVKFKNNGKIKSVRFLGVGGISMSALAEYLKSLGYRVSGVDRANSHITERLKKKGIEIGTPFDIKNPFDVAVYTSAIDDKNEELRFYKTRGRAIKRSELLGEILSGFKTAICVSGTHGKTTATSMIAHILICAGVDPTMFLGGEDLSFGNLRIGKKKYAVAEACEFEKNFLDLKPDISVILNIDNDHKGSFLGFEDQKFSFTRFAGKSLCVINADDKACMDIRPKNSVTFGIENCDADYTAKRVVCNRDGVIFTAYKRNKKLFRIKLNVIGKHNVYNALAAIGVADSLGIPATAMQDGFLAFRGVKRRAEYIGDAKTKKVIADYAHHPTEIKATLDSFNAYGENTLVIFEPHTFSRTKALLSDFTETLKKVKNLIICKTYPARERYDKAGSGKTLFNRIKEENGNAKYVKSKTALETEIISAPESVKYILVLGAGGVYETVRKIIQKNNKSGAFSLAKKSE